MRAGDHGLRYALKRKGTGWTFGVMAFFLALFVLVTYGETFAPTIYKTYYTIEVKPNLPKGEVKLIEQGVSAGLWALTIFTYWLAARSVRVGARQFIEAVASKE